MVSREKKKCLQALHDLLAFKHKRPIYTPNSSDCYESTPLYEKPRPTVYTITLSGGFEDKLNEIIRKDGTNLEVVVRKSLQLYIAAYDGRSKDMRLELSDPRSASNKIEIIGL